MPAMVDSRYALPHREYKHLYSTDLMAIKEGVTGVIDLPDDDPLAFARLIEYLYTLDYNDRSAEKGE